jgi:zinc transport system substrate-binding protein
VALTGLEPTSEPSPRAIAKLVETVRAAGATTVFVEPLLADDLARVVAREAGVETATLDPLEGLTEAELRAGADYFTVMRENLATLRTALGCR